MKRAGTSRRERSSDRDTHTENIDVCMCEILVVLSKLPPEHYHLCLLVSWKFHPPMGSIIPLVPGARDQTLIRPRAFGSHSDTNVPVYILRRMFSAWAETEL